MVATLSVKRSVYLAVPSVAVSHFVFPYIYCRVCRNLLLFLYAFSSRILSWIPHLLSKWFTDWQANNRIWNSVKHCVIELDPLVWPEVSVTCFVCWHSIFWVPFLKTLIDGGFSKYNLLKQWNFTYRIALEIYHFFEAHSITSLKFP